VRCLDVRVIAATSRDLGAMVAEGRFRADLYYRLNVLPIRLPRLAERLDDLEALAEALLDDIARRSALPHKMLDSGALEVLSRQPWPGNIRQLRNVLEQAALMTDDVVLDASRIALSLAEIGAPDVAGRSDRPPQGAAATSGVLANAAPAEGATPTADTVVPLAQAIADLETRSIRAALVATSGNKVAAARLLGISRAKLYERLKGWALRAP
jgi:DNA-binding NtrC family response regulator